MIRNQWYAILPSKEVKMGKITAVKRLGEKLALFRDEKGNVACVTDQCSHRGAALSKGKSKNGCIACPFHALEFDADGKCTFIPANGKSSQMDMSRYNVKSYPVRERNEIIYLWYGEKEKMEEELPFFNEEIDFSYVYCEMKDLWNAHYSRCIENQLDVVHVPIVHYNTIGRGNKTLIHGPRVEVWENGLRTSANNEEDHGQRQKDSEECVIKSTYLLFRFPNIWLNHITSKIKVFIYFAPVDEENTILYLRFYCRITSWKAINKLIARFGNIADGVIERQDKRVVITQTPKASAFFSDEKLLAGDSPIVMYRKMREEKKK